MNLTIEIICCVIQTILVVYSIKIWHWRCLLSPGFYFGIIWGLGSYGAMLFSELRIFRIFYTENVIELYKLTGFTALCFIYFTWRYRKKVNRNHAVKIEIMTSYKWFKILSLFTLFVAIGAFVSAGANFDMGAARETMHENVEKQSVLVGYAQAMAVPLSIVAGSILGKVLQGQIRMKLTDKLFLFVPLIANLFFSIYLGGRVNFAYSCIQYGIGFALTLKINQSAAISKKIFAMATTGAIVLVVFISAVSVQRQQHFNETSTKFNKVAQLGAVYAVTYGPMEYMVSSYRGYQYRRNDAVDLNKLGYGIYTFNGFINWSLPFAARFGLEKFTIADAFDVRYHNQETYDYKRIFYNSTHSCYIPLMKDFGPKAIYLAIIFITWISMYLFVKIQNKNRIRWATSIFFYYLFLEYWIKSNYYGTLSNSIMIFLYGLLILDIINYFLRQRRKRSIVNA